MTGKVYCVTMNTAPSLYLNTWFETARYFGYLPVIVGLNTKWRGWKHRTRIYRNALHGLEMKNDDLVMLCDSNDLFFVASAKESYDKFIKLNSSILMGAESQCCTGDMNLGKVGNLKTNRHTYKYPNGGWLMGYQKHMIHLLDLIKDESDDQAGYLKLYLNNPSKYFTLDTEQSICGNLHNADQPLEKYYLFDDKNNRFKNQFTGQYPCVLHFPGKNFDSYQTIIKHLQFPFLPTALSELQEKLSDSTSVWCSPPWWRIIIVTIVILMFLCCSLTIVFD